MRKPILPLSEQSNEFFQRPDMIRDPSCHRGRDSQTLMDAAEADFKLGTVSGVSGVSLFTCILSRFCNSAVLTEYGGVRRSRIHSASLRSTPERRRSYKTIETGTLALTTPVTPPVSDTRARRALGCRPECTFGESLGLAGRYARRCAFPR